MILSTLDWIIILSYFIVSITIGLVMSRRASKSTSDFFLSGRNLPWYVAGTSMVATTFAADTPLAVTELVAEHGIAGNWLWWNMIFGGMLTVFFFARLWRRAGIMTDCEFVAIRYEGKAAHFLRGMRAIYIGVLMNVIVIAWVNLAMVKILSVLFPELTFFGYSSINILGIQFSSHLLVVGSILVFVALYSSLSGLWGVSLTDSFQFVIAMTGSIALAVIATTHADIGGVENLKNSLPNWVLDYTPAISDGKSESGTNALQLTMIAFITYIGVQWWASWYPGAEPGGGGYVAQRMMSAKNEKHSLFATLWFQIAHFALRPWPWIIVALVALVVFPKAPDIETLKTENAIYYQMAEKVQKSPEILKSENYQNDEFLAYYEKYENTVDPGKMYPKLMVRYLPQGILGLLIAAFLAAFMSTIASQTVWGTSYIVNDLFRPYIKPNGTEKYYVKISRITTFILLFFALIVTSQLEKISDAWKFILECSGGIGLVLILRWFWWRINAWSEIAALIAPFPAYIYLNHIGVDFPDRLILIVIWSTFVWITVTLLTPPTKEKTLIDFYKRVHPGGLGWKKIARQTPETKSDSGFIYLFVNWFCGCILVIASLFGIGNIIFGEWWSALIMISLAAISSAIIFFNMKKIGWKKITE